MPSFYMIIDETRDNTEKMLNVLNATVESTEIVGFDVKPGKHMTLYNIVVKYVHEYPLEWQEDIAKGVCYNNTVPVLKNVSKSSAGAKEGDHKLFDEPIEVDNTKSVVTDGTKPVVKKLVKAATW